MAAYRRALYAHDDSLNFGWMTGMVYAQWGELDSATVDLGQAVALRQVPAAGSVPFGGIRGSHPYVHIRPRPYLDQLIAAGRPRR